MMSNRCGIADGNCEIDTNKTCFGCGNAVCGGCSELRLYQCYQVRGGWKKRIRRICQECIEEGAD
jgi:hypothetical protein